MSDQGNTQESRSEALGASPSDAAVWARFMAATLSAAPHAPVDKLAATADEALLEYRKRRRSEGVFETPHSD
jgi:hypothetical protein